MNTYGYKSFPLTTAQRGLWFSQKITPGAIMNIAEAVEICGPIQPETFRRALHQVVSEAEQLRVRVVEQDAKPRQILGLAYQGHFPYLDMSREADPRAAIEAWMMQELARPVDLANDPLWFSALLKASDDRYFWYHRAHHIVCDGYGGGLVARRLSASYTAYAEGREPSPDRFCTVEEVLEAENSYRNSGRFQRDRDYWLERLAHLPEAATLSRSRRRYGLSNSLRRSIGHVSAETVRQLAELGKTAGISLPQILISLIAAYYQRATGVSDLVFGMPVSGRLNAALRRAVSVCANMVPIRLSFTTEMTAAELFAQVSRTVLQALRHQQYRYEDLRRDLGLVGQDQNVVRLGINIEPFDYRLNFDGATAILHNLSNSSTEDLVVFVYDRGTNEGLRFDLDANPALYSVSELDEHRRRLMRLIEQVLANPGMPLRQLDILGVEERHRLLVGWNRTSAVDMSLPAVVAEWAAATPDEPAVVFEDTVLSYRQLHDRSVQQARQLLASGVKPGDIVAVAYRTGDLVRWSGDGLLEFIGRSDDQVKVNGYRVELGEIESVLLQHAAVAAAAVTAHRDGDGAISLAAYLVGRGTPIDIDSLRIVLAGRLPNSMVPTSFMVLDAMPLTPTGKLDRKALPSPERAGSSVHAEPVTPAEKELAALWQQVLKVERVGLHDNFFELGGDSLNAAEIAAHFPARFEMELPLGSLFEAPTIATLAALVERLGSEHTDPLSTILPLRKAGSTAARPLFCIHPIIGVSMGFSGLLRFLDPMIPVYGLQSRGLRGAVSLPGSIDEIAADYLAQIRRIQPTGPYRLIGRSLGGLIGHAIARQMQSQGLRVDLLAMIDTYMFTSGAFAPTRTEADEVRAALSFLGIHLAGENTPQTLQGLNEFLLHPANARSIPQVQGAIKLAREIEKSHPEFISRLPAVMLNNLKLARQYVPHKVDVDLLYFHATEITGDLEGILDRSPWAWTPFVRGIQVHELACHHEAVLNPVPAAQIASKLRQRLTVEDGQWASEVSPAIRQKNPSSSPAWA